MATRLHARIAWTAALLVLAGALAGCQPETGPRPGATPRPSSPTTPSAPATRTPLAWPSVSLEPRWSGLSVPLYVTSARDASGRIFIVEKTGRIRIVRDGRLLARPFLDVGRLVSGGGEQGLLGLAFPPEYATRRRFYIYYTDPTGDVRIARVGLTSDPDVADRGSLTPILTIPHRRFSNHNGGQLAFGPDGFLYAGVGDGGGAGDAEGNAQDLGSLKGKLLRIDPESDPRYAVPSSNPFVGRAGARPEIWAYGLRNPWRFSFDRMTRELWIADVGQDAWEEIDLQPAGSAGGQDYGWPRYEGTHVYPPGSTAAPTGGVTFPVDEYPHSLGESVTGGYVYRGVAIPALRGVYVYADWKSGVVLGLRNENGAWVRRTLLETGRGITSFGEDEAGELYVCDGAGAVLQVVAAP